MTDNSIIKQPKLIGEGSYGCVIQPPLKNQYVKKYVEYTNIRDDDVGKLFKPDNISSFKKELNLLTAVQKIDPNSTFTVALKGAFSINSSSIKLENVNKCLNVSQAASVDIYQIVLAYGGKELSDVTRYSIPFSKCIKMLTVFLKGIKEMHSKEIIHRDIKPANVLVSDSKISLIDFGISEKAQDVFSNTNYRVLSYVYPYYPPEFFVSSLLLKYKNDKETFLMKLDDVIRFMEHEFFEKLFIKTHIPIVKSEIVNFINEIKKRNLSYDEVFNERMAYNCDIFSLSFVFKELASKIIYTNDEEKKLFMRLEKMSSEYNPFLRPSVSSMLELISNASNVSNQGNVSNVSNQGNASNVSNASNQGKDRMISNQQIPLKTGGKKTRLYFTNKYVNNCNIVRIASLYKCKIPILSHIKSKS